MDISVAKITIEGFSPMFQSKQHAEPKLSGEGFLDYEIRTWRSKANTEERNGINEVYIPGAAIHQMLFSAAKYSKKQIPGQGKATWRGKFEAGVAVLDHGYLGINVDDLKPMILSVPSDGIRGSGKRVTKYFPVIPKGWRTEVEVMVLDPIIVRPIFTEMVKLGGMFVGLGSFRPQNAGQYGRFNLVDLDWQDNRSFV